MMVDTCHYTFVPIRRAYDTKSEPSCTVRTLGECDETNVASLAGDAGHGGGREHMGKSLYHSFDFTVNLELLEQSLF